MARKDGYYFASSDFGDVVKIVQATQALQTQHTRSSTDIDDKPTPSTEVGKDEKPIVITTPVVPLDTGLSGF